MAEERPYPQGRVALVTGASRGIGAAVAERLAAEGADVVLVARTLDHHERLPGSLRETAERCSRHGGRVELVVADLADPEDRTGIVPTALERMGRVDVLVNNAAASIHASTLDYPARRRRVTFELNFEAPLDLMQAVIPGMVSRGEGWIVNVSSATARAAAGPPFRTGGSAALIGVYGASKAALNRLTNAIAVETYGTGVRANTVEPRAAVATEGAVAVLGRETAEALAEPMEAMVEATVALACCEPERTGGCYVSLDLLDELAVPVRALDGSPYPEPVDPPVA
jgi:citronellol/citronellal dehydrogenase